MQHHRSWARALFAVFALVLVMAPLFLTACTTTTEPPTSITIGGFNIVLYSPEAKFPDYINFRMEVEGNTDITGLSLQYQVDKLTAIPVTSVAFPGFDPAVRVDAAWKWDMRRTGGLPPGTTISYWWSIRDSEGGSADTPVQTLTFDDQRYSWKSKESNNITIWWYQGRDSFAEELMTAAQQGTQRLSEDIGAGLKMPVKIYVYASYTDLRGALVFPQEWTGGVAYTHYGIIAIGIPLAGLDWGKRAIAHELAHLVVHQAIFSGYGVDLPTWLSEGLSMYSEGSLSPDFAVRLQNAIDQDRVFTVRSLSSSFPTDEESARLAYAQSYSLVSFLLEVHGGRAKMTELLDAFKNGSGYVEALDNVYGLDIDQINSQWREYVGLGGTS
jgi:hypothetical protein